MSFNCPKCQSDQTQSIHVIIAAGTQRGAQSTSAAGVGFGGGGMGLGVGSANTSTFQQSDLARRLAPGPYPSDGAGIWATGIIMSFLCILLAIGGLGTGALICGLIGGPFLLAAIVGRKGRKEAQQHWKERKDYLSRAWFCHRCGTDFTPGV